MTTYQVVSESALSDLPDKIVVASGYGRVALAPPRDFTSEGEFVRAGAVIATIASDRDHIDVCAPCDAWVIGYIVRDGQRVQPGTPIAHVRAI